MKHQIGRKKLNMKPPRKRSMIRNQVIHFIHYSQLQTTKVRIKEVQKEVEKLVTISLGGWNFNTIRRVKQLLPYDMEAIEKLIKEIAPKYLQRAGGYTRVIPLGQRASDTATVAKLEWV